MLHRVKKADDINEGKWIGLGGKFEAGESPEACLLREVREEAGVELTDFRLRGMVSFFVEGKPEDSMLIFVYTASDWSGDVDLDGCSEGELTWVDTDAIDALNLWEGDRLFWNWLRADEGFFSARFIYEDERLAHHDVTFY